MIPRVFCGTLSSGVPSRKWPVRFSNKACFMQITLVNRSDSSWHRGLTECVDKYTFRGLFWVDCWWKGQKAQNRQRSTPGKKAEKKETPAQLRRGLRSMRKKADQSKCFETSLVISNMLTVFLPPNNAFSLSSALMFLLFTLS